MFDCCPTIIVLYEAKNTVDQIADVFNSRYRNRLFININKEQSKFAKILKEQHEAILYVYVFDHPEEARKIRDFLASHPLLDQQVELPQLSLLFCEKQHRELALNMCNDDIFYHYETLKPIYDLNHLSLTVHRAVELLQCHLLKIKLEKEVKNLSEKLVSTHSTLDGIKDSLTDHQSAQSERLNKVTKPIGQLLENVTLLEWRRAYDNTTKSLSSKELDCLADQFPVEEIRESMNGLNHENSKALDTIVKAIETAKPKIEHSMPLILLADDQLLIQKIVTTIIELRGMRIESAMNGVEALLKAKVMMPDIVLLDIDMPTMDGFTTLQAFQSDEQLRDIPVIMLTSESDKEMIKTCIEYGATDYILKPTQAETLIRKVKRAIQQKRKQIIKTA
ncbi:response regulator [Pseudoalteromonas xiamenensis]|uniref:Response regulator n=1 Tax=Pseudoalteromonas xiamenensis TaxID=882626 RepID=A0A975DKN7_9GAMM|nr:response regulator [Pseudoalteromonas xiamenensis]QTH73606.1 response regulator [Pseudoalteromonas xiamenensis]